MAFYGIPIEKKYPLNDEDDVLRAILSFNKCPVIKRKILADNINDRIRTFDMLITLEKDNDFINYIDKRYLADISNKELRGCYLNGCRDIAKISDSGKSINEYNKEVYNTMKEFIRNTSDIDKIYDFLRDGNEYADKITREKAFTDREFALSMSVINHLCESLYLISLQYNVSKDYVNNLLDDLEEMYVEFQDNYVMKRKVLALNQYNTKCLKLKSELNTLIGKRTKDLLEGKVSVRAVGKMSRLMLRHNQNDESLTNYLKDKQNDLKEYFTMQNKYFLSGFSFHKSCLTGMCDDSYSMFETEMDLQHRVEDIMKVLKKYPKLNLEISYSDIYRLHKRFSYVKQLPLKGLSNITIVSMNEGQIYIVTKKKGDNNTFYLIKYNDLLNLSLNLMREDEVIKPKSIKGIKLIFKNEVLDENISSALESCTKF